MVDFFCITKPLHHLAVLADHGFINDYLLMGFQYLAEDIKNQQGLLDYSDFDSSHTLLELVIFFFTSYYFMQQEVIYANFVSFAYRL